MASSTISKSIRVGLSVFSIAALALTSLSLTPLVGASPAMAEGMEDNPSKEPGAKGLFFQQLEKPKENINTGLRYWIEMKRDGDIQRVSNKMQFKSGDSIRFHVRSNIDGYAYILLSSGSRGEQAVLFPDEKSGEKNKVGAGHEYVLPGNGYLTFDENPGTEKLTLLLSRTPVDAQSYLAKPAGNKEITLIASNTTGSKDLVPARIYVAYSAPHSEGPPPILLAAANKQAAEKAEADKSDKSDKNNKVKKVEKKVAKQPVAVASNTNTSTTSTTVSTVHKTPVTKRGGVVAYANARNPKDDEGTTTVVSEKSSGVLHVDVDLDHI